MISVNSSDRPASVNHDAFAMVQQVLNQFAQEVGLPGLALNAHGGCSLDLGDRFVHLEVDAKAVELSIYSEVALLPVPVKPALLEMMMHANYFTLRTAGATLGLEGVSGQVVLYLRLSAERLDCGRLAERLESFVAAADLWSSRLAMAGSPAAAGSVFDQPNSPLNPSLVIQG
jgi:hypothetical protein